MNYADLHNHTAILVDDGCESQEEALESLRNFRAAGVTEIACTPHLDVARLETHRDLQRDVDALRMAAGEVEALSARDEIGVAVRSGQEILAPSAREIQRALQCSGIGIRDTQTVLVEFGFGLRQDPISVIHAARDAGWRIIVAHPERYRYPAGTDPLEWIAGWREAGAFLQLNLGSVFRSYSPPSAETAVRLLKSGLLHLVASDHHGPHRPQILHQDFRFYLSEGYGADRVAELLLGENPRRILNGLDPLPVDPL